MPHRTYALAPDYQGCGHPDPDHSYEGGRIEYNGGACDGWLRAGDNDEYAIGYYTKKDLPFFGSAATRWTVCDRYFSAIMAGDVRQPHLPARRADRSARPTRSSSARCRRSGIGWRRAGLDGRYYFSDVPFLALVGRQVPPDRATVRGVPRRCRGWHAAARVVRGAAFPRRRGRRRRTTIIRSPTSATARRS